MHSPSPRPRFSLPVFWLGLATNGLFAAIRYLIWKVSDGMIQLLLLPLELLAAGVVLLVGIEAIWRLRRVRAEGWGAAFPLLSVLLGAIGIWAVIPGFDLPERENFRRYRRDREAVLGLVRAGRLAKIPSSPRFRALPWRYRHVADSGEVLVDPAGGAAVVVFYTFRGLLNSGGRAIVYTETDDPNIWGYTAYAEQEQLAPHWFRVVERD